MISFSFRRTVQIFGITKIQLLRQVIFVHLKHSNLSKQNLNNFLHSDDHLFTLDLFMIKPVNSISISEMLTSSHLLGQKVKPRWPPMEGNFVGQFQSSLRSFTSVPVLYTTFNLDGKKRTRT